MRKIYSHYTPSAFRINHNFSEWDPIFFNDRAVYETAGSSQQLAAGDRSLVNLVIYNLFI